MHSKEMPASAFHTTIFWGNIKIHLYVPLKLCIFFALYSSFVINNVHPCNEIGDYDNHGSERVQEARVNKALQTNPGRC